MNDSRLTSETQAHEYLVKKFADKVEVTGVKIVDNVSIDDHLFWQYSLEGLPVPRTRHEYWLRDDTETYSIFQCFEHSIEQVARNEVSGPHHKGEDDK